MAKVQKVVDFFPAEAAFYVYNIKHYLKNYES